MLGWFRFLEGLVKYFDICYLERGIWLLCINLSNLGLFGFFFCFVFFGLCGFCWLCLFYLIFFVFLFGGIFILLIDFKIFYNFEILYIVKVYFIFINVVKCM